MLHTLLPSHTENYIEALAMAIRDRVSKELGINSAEKKKAAATLNVVKRLATPDDANGFLFLASDSSSFISGETVNANGARLMDYELPTHICHGKKTLNHWDKSDGIRGRNSEKEMHHQ